MTSKNSFDSRATISVDGKTYTVYRLAALDALSSGNAAKLPFSLKILLENLLRNEDEAFVKRADIDTLAKWDVTAAREQEIAFRTARVLLQDFTGVPAVVDLAAMRDAIASLGGDPQRINPLQPVDLVIDHSVQVDEYGSAAAFLINTELEFERNQERYVFLRWGQDALKNFRAVPPGTGICHQVNLEYLGRTVFVNDETGEAYPDSLVGTDSHTTMINGLGVLGWGVGGIEAEAAMLGQPVSMLIPEVVGFKLHGKLPPGATATDLVLTVTEMLRKKKVVGKFVEFYGTGLTSLPLADRATIANMAPEYGATMGFFPVDEETLKYLRLSGRAEHHVKLVEAYTKEQGLFRTDATPDPRFTDTIELDLGTVEPSLAGPKRPQDRVPLSKAKTMYREALEADLAKLGTPAAAKHLKEATKVSAEPELAASAVIVAPGEEVAHEGVRVEYNGQSFTLRHGAVVIAAITSCTNTSNPSVMLAAGLLARNAVKKGLTRKPWVKTSLAPGSKVVTDYLRQAGVQEFLDQLGFQLVGYGCTTCIGNSGPLPEPIQAAIESGTLITASVLSGNRNFEGRVNPHTRFNYLASPPLVVAYSLAGRMDLDLTREPLGVGKDGPVFLRDIWPTPQEVADEVARSVKQEFFKTQYADVFKGDAQWQSLDVPKGETYAWDEKSTYVKNPPYFQGMTMEPPGIRAITGARALALLGDSITTDHISPAGNIPASSPAGKWLIEHGVDKKDFNSYGARRGNHEVMMRGTFANIRLRNEMVPGKEGGFSTTEPGGEPQFIYDVSMGYQSQGTPLMIVAGKEYGTGSSRDWAAKGTILLGVRAVIAESFERIHRSNLVGMGVLPLEFANGDTRQSLGITGFETFDVVGLDAGLTPRKTLSVRMMGRDGKSSEFNVLARIDTPEEMNYYKNGGILQYVLRQLVGGRA
jgi:aconitate hydratase